MKCKYSESGNGNVMVLLACAGIVVVWFIFTIVMDIIGANTQARTRRNLEKLNAFEKPKPPEGPRHVRGYQVSY